MLRIQLDETFGDLKFKRKAMKNRKIGLMRSFFLSSLIFKDKLFCSPVESSFQDLPSPEFFKNRIIVKVLLG